MVLQARGPVAEKKATQLPFREHARFDGWNSCLIFLYDAVADMLWRRWFMVQWVLLNLMHVVMTKATASRLGWWWTGISCALTAWNDNKKVVAVHPLADKMWSCSLVPKHLYDTPRRWSAYDLTVSKYYQQLCAELEGHVCCKSCKRPEVVVY